MQPIFDNLAFLCPKSSSMNKFAPLAEMEDDDSPPGLDDMMPK
jgi:hypothetical protein